MRAGCSFPAPHFGNRNMKKVVITAFLISLLVLAVWLITGADYYTKFQVVEQVTVEVDPHDPLAQAGFYDEEGKTETVTRDEFRLGLLPTPQGLFDKHALSVLSIMLPLWIIVLVVFYFERRRS